MHGDTNKFDLLSLQMPTKAYRQVLQQRAAKVSTYLVLNMGQSQLLQRHPQDDMTKELCSAFDVTGILCMYMLPQDEGTFHKSLKLLKRKANRTMPPTT